MLFKTVHTVEDLVEGASLVDFFAHAVNEGEAAEVVGIDVISFGAILRILEGIGEKKFAEVAIGVIKRGPSRSGQLLAQTSDGDAAFDTTGTLCLVDLVEHDVDSGPVER